MSVGWSCAPSLLALGQDRGWAGTVASLGLTKQVISETDRDADTGKKRGLGVALSAHGGESLCLEKELERCSLQLERKQGRFDESRPHLQCRSVVQSREPVQKDDSA